MKLYCSVYWDEQLTDEKEKIIQKIKKNDFKLVKYFVCLTESEMNHMEIFQSFLMMQKRVSKSNKLLVGIAGSYLGALEIVEKITQEVYDKTNNVDIRRYIMNKQEEFEKETNRS